jgi:hypothetical protein
MAFAIDHYFYVSKNLRPGENGMDISSAFHLLGSLYFLFTVGSDSQGLIILQGMPNVGLGVCGEADRR